MHTKLELSVIEVSAKTPEVAHWAVSVKRLMILWGEAKIAQGCRIYNFLQNLLGVAFCGASKSESLHFWLSEF